MELEVSPPLLARLLLLPLVILLDRPLPVLQSLYVLTALLRVCLETQHFCKLALPFEPCGVARETRRGIAL